MISYKNVNIGNVKLAVKIIVAVAFIWFLVTSDSISFEELKVIKNHPITVFIALVCLFMGIVLSGIRWWLILCITNRKTSLKTVLYLQLMGSFFSSWLPGAAGGDAIRGVMLYRLFPNGRSTALISIATDRIYSILGLVSVALFSTLYIKFGFVYLSDTNL